MRYIRLALAVLICLLCLGTIVFIGINVGDAVVEGMGFIPRFVLFFAYLSFCAIIGRITGGIVSKLIAENSSS